MTTATSSAATPTAPWPTSSTPRRTNFTNFKQFSEEAQYAGVYGRLNWQVGAFFSHEVLNSGTQTAFGTQLGPYVAALSTLPAAAFVPGEGAIDRYHQVEHSEALYTQETFKITDKLSITGGLRYTWEHKDLTSTFSNNDTTNLCANLLQLVTGSPTPFRSRSTSTSRRPPSEPPA